MKYEVIEKLSSSSSAYLNLKPFYSLSFMIIFIWYLPSTDKNFDLHNFRIKKTTKIFYTLIAFTDNTMALSELVLNPTAITASKL